MEQRGVLLRGIARVLNAGGSAIVTVYDVTASTLGKVLPGEKKKLDREIRLYENKIERLYYEIGKAVSTQGDRTEVAAAEAAVKLVAECRMEIEVLKQRIEEAEAAEKIERQRLLEQREAARITRVQEAKKKVAIVTEYQAPGREGAEESYPAETEPVIIAAPPLAEAPVPVEASAVAGTEEVKEMTAEAVETLETAETVEDRFPEAPSAIEEPVPVEASAGAETEEEGGTSGGAAGATEPAKGEPHTYTREELEPLLKNDLLNLCAQKGIEADRRMTKAAIIDLLLGRQSE